jgi:mannose-6-phosphate isomerase-like protein (cupin superfamily)
LLETNRFFWNAGIFLFRADTYLEELERFEPEILAACRRAVDGAAMDTEFVRPDPEAFRDSPADSIDYAVMEKTDRACMVPLSAGWSDVGSWTALHEVSDKDEAGNSLHGDVVAYDCHDSYISAGSRLVTAVGIENVVVVEDKDSVLVAHKDRTQDVKALVDELKRRGRGETRLHRQVFRPWGSYDSIDGEEGFQVKRLIVNPGAVLSLQKHARRAEHWVVVRGTARITRNDEVFDLAVNESTYIPIGADLQHLLAALDVDHVGHAALDVRARHGDAIADVEEGVLVGTLVDRRIDRREFFARREQESPDGRLAPDVLVPDQRLEAVPALAEENRILAAGLAPGDEILARVGRRIKVPAVGLDARRLHGGRGKTGGSQRRAAGDECASLQNILLGADPI